jgi:hypothetical protein
MTVTNYQTYPQFPSSGSGGGGASLIERIEFDDDPYYDMAIPAEGDFLDVELLNLRFSADQNTLAYAVSTDSKATWIHDPINLDCYWLIRTKNNGAAGTTNLASGDTLGINVGVQYLAGPALFGITAAFRIYPGSPDYLFQMQGRLMIDDWNASKPIIYEPLFTYVNPYATVTPTPARATHIRWRPYGNADVDPTSGVTMTGVLSLFAGAS